MIPDKQTISGIMVTMSSSASGSLGLSAWWVLRVCQVLDEEQIRTFKIGSGAW